MQQSRTNQILLQRVIYILVLTLCTAVNLRAQVKSAISFNSESSTELEQYIQKNASDFITAVNIGFSSDELPVIEAFTTPEGRKNIEQLWKNNVKFYCSLTEIQTDLLRSSTGFQIRRIPLLLNQKDEEGIRLKSEGVLIINKNGLIEDLVFGLEKQQYDVLLGKKENVEDGRRKTIILDFLENFRTAYNRKDSAFLKDVFSNDALIIVGRVVQIEQTDLSGTSVQSTVVNYSTQTKSEYMTNLSRAFEANEFIKVGFSEISIVRHPVHNSIYGVTLFQDWVSTNYKDSGYLFLMMDFTDEDAPMIHVRTWQPELYTTEEEVYQLNDFWIEVNESN